MNDQELRERAMRREVVGNGARQIALLAGELAEYDAIFDLHWTADMRGIKKWQETTGRTLTWPDHADLVVYLAGRLEAADAVIDAARPLAKVIVKREELDAYHARGMDIALHIAAYDATFGKPDKEADG